MKVIKKDSFLDQMPSPVLGTSQTSPIEFRLKTCSLTPQQPLSINTVPERTNPTIHSETQPNTSAIVPAVIPKGAPSPSLNKETEVKGIKSWSEDDRPREKMQIKGVSSLSNSELLAILIRNGSKDRSAVEVSKDILQLANNNLFELGKMDYVDFLEVMGVGKVKAITISAALELGRRRHLQSREEKSQILSSNEAYREIGAALMDIGHEEFWVIYLDSQSRVIKKKMIGKGGVTKVFVETSFIFREAILCKARSIILVHNHPSGRLKPSKQDVDLTQKVKQGCEVFNLILSDHIIVGDSGYFSFLDDNML